MVIKLTTDFVLLKHTVAKQTCTQCQGRNSEHNSQLTSVPSLCVPHKSNLKAQEKHQKHQKPQNATHLCSFPVHPARQSLTSRKLTHLSQKETFSLFLTCMSSDSLACPVTHFHVQWPTHVSSDKSFSITTCPVTHSRVQWQVILHPCINSCQENKHSQFAILNNQNRKPVTKTTFLVHWLKPLFRQAKTFRS